MSKDREVDKWMFIHIGINEDRHGDRAIDGYRDRDTRCWILDIRYEISNIKKTLEIRHKCT